MTLDQIENWNGRHAILMFCLSCLVLFTQRIELLSLGAIISFSSLIHRNSKDLKKMVPSGGYANLVTGIRLLLLIIGSFLFSTVSKEVLFGIMTCAVLLDILDGFLARKYGHTSIFGQYFDMEVDAFFVLLMCFYYFQYQEIGWWILIPGVLRYVFRIFTLMFPKEGYVESKKSYAAMVAGTFFTILLACILFNLPYALLIGSIAIMLSFSVSIIEYLRY